MQKLLLYGLPLGLIISLIIGLNNNFSYSQQTSTVKTTTSSVQNTDEYSNDDTVGDDVNNFTVNSQVSSSSSNNIQRNSLTVSAANLKQPHILTINSEAAKLQGQIKINGKTVKRLNSNSSEINLSPYLSVGQQKVEVSAHYTPTTASVSVDMKSPDSNISQQTSGNGILNYTLDLSVQ